MLGDSLGGILEKLYQEVRNSTCADLFNDVTLVYYFISDLLKFHSVFMIL